MDKRELYCFGRISVCFGALRGAPMDTDGWYTPPRHQQGRLTWQRHSTSDFTVWGVHTSLIQRGQKNYGAFGPISACFKALTDKLHPDTNNVGWHNRHSLCDITMKGVHTTLLEQGQRKTVLLGVSLIIWGQMVTDGGCTLPRHQQGRLTWQRHSICDFTMGRVHTIEIVLFAGEYHF